MLGGALQGVALLGDVVSLVEESVELWEGFEILSAQAKLGAFLSSCSPQLQM